jgi:hypothetical protein
MNNKPVCLHCDELLFDMEIECEEFELPTGRRQPAKEPTAPSLKRGKGKTTTK